MTNTADISATEDSGFTITAPSLFSQPDIKPQHDHQTDQPLIDQSTRSIGELLSKQPADSEASDKDAPTAYQSDALAMAEHIRFGGGYMHVTPQLVESKVRRARLSPSTTSSLLDDCPSSWAFGKLLPFDDSPFSPAGAGGLAHEVLENFYQRKPRDRDGLALAEEVSKVVHRTFPDDAAQAALLTQKINSLAEGVFDLEDPTAIDVNRVEETIDATIDGIPVTGTVDRTEYVDDGDLWIADYKSGKFRQKDYRVGYERAMRIYALLKEAQTGVLPVGTSLLFTAAGEEVDVSVSPRHLDKARRDMAAAWELHNTAVETSAFPTTASPLCGWCPLAKLCPTAQEASWEPSQKAIDAGVEFIDPPAPIATASQPDAAGHCVDEAEDFNDGIHDATPQHDPEEDSMTKTTDRKEVIERAPQHMLTIDGDMNPNSWAANIMFRLFNATTKAVDTHNAEVTGSQRQDLIALVFKDVTDVITDEVVEWTGTEEPTPQMGAFTRLSHVAMTFIDRQPCNFDDAGETEQWLNLLADELHFATTTVLHQFDELVPIED